MTLDSASKTLTDGRTRHVDLLAFREDFDRDGLAGLELGSLLGIDTELFQSASSFDTSLSELAGERLADARRLLRAEGDLDCGVTVGILRLNHGDAVVRHVEHSHGTDTPSSVKIRVMPILRPTRPSFSLIVFSTPAAIGRDRLHQKCPKKYSS